MPRNEYASAHLAAVLIDIQNGSCSHSKCLDRLIHLHFTDSERFKRDFAGHLNRILVAAGDKRDINIEKLVNLVIDFASGKTGTEEDSHYKRHQFALFSIQHLLDRTSVKDKSIRFRGTQILTGILQCMSSDIEIDDTLKEAITDKMIERSRDKLPAIRCFAISCLSCFQMSHSVMEEFSRLMDSDTNRDVRKAALSHIRISKHTLPSILRRTRDVKEDVRALAFDILTKKVNPEKLSSRQRCDLINELLKEGANAQKEITLLKNWISLRFGNDIMQLCEMLDVENNEDVAEQALKRVLGVTNLASPFVLSSTGLNPSTCFYWRVFCEHLKSQKLEDALDDALPTLSEYCNILHEATLNSKSVFTLKQLLLGCTLFDTADEVGRAKLTSLLGSMLTSAPLEVVTIVTKSLFVVEAEGTECIRLMVESISELMDPLEEDDDIKKLKENLKALQNRQAKGVSKDASLQDKIAKIEGALQGNEQRTWIRCCTITEQLLENINKGLQNPMVAGLFHSVILPSVKHASPEIRNKGIKLLGLFCLFDKEMATSHVPIFIQAISRDGQDVKITAMKILFDFLLAYNLDPAVKDSQQPSPAAQSIQKFLKGYFHSDDEDLRSTCVEGFAKLLLADVVLDSNVLSELLEQYYHPQTATLPRLRRCLHVFFHTYLRPRSNSNQRVRLFRKAISSALKTFVYSPSSLELPLIEVANYLVNLLRLANSKSGSNMEENKLVIKIVKLLKADPNGVASTNLCKILRILRLDNIKPEDAELLRQISQKAIKDTEDKFVSTTLEKLLEMGQITNQIKLSPTGNQKPSEPASPSPPGSPYFTESPSHQTVERPAPGPSETNVKDETKTPVSRKKQKNSDSEKALGDFFTQQKRAFAELDGFALEVEVTPKKARKLSIPSIKPPTTPLPLQAPNTVPRVTSRNKRVKFESTETSQQGFAASFTDHQHHTPRVAHDNKNKSTKNNNNNENKHKNITHGSNSNTTTTKNKRKHEDIKDDTKEKPLPPKPRYVLSFTGFNKGPDATALLTSLRNQATALQMTCLDSDGLDSTVTHVVAPAGRKTVKTMTARLAGLWVVDPQWIVDSAKASKIMPEFKYGTKQQNCLFDGKSFHFAPAFLASTPRSTIHNCKTFISLARGTLTSNSAHADYVLVPPEMLEAANEEFSSSVCLDTKQFFGLITV